MYKRVKPSPNDNRKDVAWIKIMGFPLSQRCQILYTRRAHSVNWLPLKKTVQFVYTLVQILAQAPQNKLYSMGSYNITVFTLLRKLYELVELEHLVCYFIDKRKHVIIQLCRFAKPINDLCKILRPSRNQWHYNHTESCQRKRGIKKKMKILHRQHQHNTFNTSQLTQNNWKKTSLILDVSVSCPKQVNKENARQQYSK